MGTDSGGYTALLLEYRLCYRCVLLLWDCLPPTLVFMAAMFGLLLLTLMLSVIDSHQTDRIISLTQKIALLEERLSRVEKRK